MALSQGAFGELVGMSETAVCRLERGSLDIRTSQLEKISAALGFHTLADFLTSE